MKETPQDFDLVELAKVASEGSGKIASALTNISSELGSVASALRGGGYQSAIGDLGRAMDKMAEKMASGTQHDYIPIPCSGANPDEHPLPATPALVHVATLSLFQSKFHFPRCARMHHAECYTTSEGDEGLAAEFGEEGPRKRIGPCPFWTERDRKI